MYSVETITNKALHETDKAFHLNTYNRFPIAFKYGRGCYLWDVEGKRYLDALAGIAVNNLGHCHPNVVKAIQMQAARLMTASNFFITEPQVKLAEKLVIKSGMDKVFFGNSGVEAIEGAFKFARKHAHSIGRGGGIVAMENCFHGRSLAAIATGKEKQRKGFDPIPHGFYRIPFNDIEAVKGMLSDEIGAIVLEPVQGEGGIRPVDPDYLFALRELCDQEGIVLIFDEIQCGIARTGKFFAKCHYGIQPDIITLAKGLGNGIPIGAFLTNKKVSDVVEYGDHGTTFGGNALACAAALATIETIEEEKITERALKYGEILKQQLKNVLGNHPSLKEIRGLGLMIGVEFDFEVKPLVIEMLKHGVIANATDQTVLRLVPPLIITEEEIEFLVSVIVKSMQNLNL